MAWRDSALPASQSQRVTVLAVSHELSSTMRREGEGKEDTGAGKEGGART